MAVSDDIARCELRAAERAIVEDVALAIRRPGSWEGGNMATVLSSHGYG